LPLLRKLSNGMNLHSYLFYQWGESMRRIVKGSQALRFWRLMPKGEKVLSPKQKDRTTILKFSKTKGKKLFQLVFELISKLSIGILFGFKILS
jgi:hypothetical protein